MKRVVLALLLLLPLASFAASAREHPQDRPPPNSEQRFEHLVEMLSLTDTQQASVREAFAEHDALISELGHGDREARDEVEAQFSSQLATLLTDDQLQRWESFKESRQKRGNDRHPPADGRRPPRQS